MVYESQSSASPVKMHSGLAASKENASVAKSCIVVTAPCGHVRRIRPMSRIVCMCASRIDAVETN